MNKYLKTFLQNAFVSGIFIGVVMVLLEYKFIKIGGVIYGALPFGFIYIIITYFFRNLSYKEKVDRLLHFSNYSIIGGLIFLLIMGAYYYALKYTEKMGWAALALAISSLVCISLVICNLKSIY